MSVVKSTHGYIVVKSTDGCTVVSVMTSSDRHTVVSVKSPDGCCGECEVPRWVLW